MAGHSKDAGTTLTVADIADPAQAYDSIVAMSVALDEKNVQKEGRWLVIPPWFYGLLQKDQRFVTGTDAADTRLTSGVVGAAAGFRVYESNNLATVKSSGVVSIMAGTNAAISLATQVLNTEALRLEKSFSDAVRGLLVYGTTVVQPNALVTLKANQKTGA